jgi:hypothetical protein
MRLVIPVVVLGADIDEADGQRGLGCGGGADQAGHGAGERTGSGSLEEIAAVHGKEFGHRNAPCGAGPVVNGYRKVHAMHVPEIKLLFFIDYMKRQDLRIAKCMQIDRIFAQKVINRYFLFIVTARLA